MRPRTARTSIASGRLQAAPAIAEWVDYLWWVRWDVAATHVQEVVPRPVVHLSAEVVDEEARLVVTGVQPQLFRRQLLGRGLTIGAAFHPGAFWCLRQSQVAELSGREVFAADLFGVDDRAVAKAVLAAGGVEAGGSLLGEWVQQLQPIHDPLTVRLAELVMQAERDSSIVRAEQLAELAGVGLRTLQRWFRRRVGIGPKWVVQRARLLDVMQVAHAAALSEEQVDWAVLAGRLGYADQSHLSRAFTRLVGQPPAAYLREA